MDRLLRTTRNLLKVERGKEGLVFKLSVGDDRSQVDVFLSNLDQHGRPFYHELHVPGLLVYHSISVHGFGSLSSTKLKKDDSLVYTDAKAKLGQAHEDLLHGRVCLFHVPAMFN